MSKKYTYEGLLRIADNAGVQTSINIIACELLNHGFPQVAQLIYNGEYDSYVQLVHILQQLFVEDKSCHNTRITCDELLDFYIRLHALSTMNLLQTNLK